MKRLTPLATVTAVLLLAICVTTVRAQNTRYFDQNDFNANSGVAPNTASMPFAWDTSTTDWNPNADGSGAGPGTTVAWVNGDDAVFSAGTDANGIRYFIDITDGVTANSVLIEDGTVVLNNGVVNTGAGTTEVLAGATLELKSGSMLTYGLNDTGTLKLSGGRLLFSGTASGSSQAVNSLQKIEINGTGTIANDDGNNSATSLATVSNVITGTGGTPTNGGAGTLIKTGPDTITLAGRDTGSGVLNWTLNSYAKLVVQQGVVRLRNVSGQIDERLFGAVPTSTLADAIKLDGGGIGTNQAVTLDSKRGVTITANGGVLDQSGGAGIIIPGPLTAAAGATLTLGNLAGAQNSARFELSNPNNTTTFQGNLSVLRSTLRLNSDLNAAHFSGNNGPSSTFGTVEVSDGITLTGGRDNQDTTFDGKIANNSTTASTGGIFKWDGTGTLSLNPIASTAKWTNTGGVVINKGTIKFASAQAGIATTVPVTIGSTAKLNMNGIAASFGSLSGPAGAIVDMKDTAASAGALTLGATSGSKLYSGTIVGGGNLTKSGGATQTLAGNTALGTVAVNGGTLRTNATMSASGGVTVGSAGTFGGGGTIVGNVLNNGILAPGDGGVGTLSVTGNVTDGASSHWAIEVNGAAADRVAVVGNIDLSAVDSLDVTGIGQGTSWIIATYTGGVSGTFDSVTSGYSVSYSGGNITLSAPATGVLGDFNNDGKVDAADYVTWKKNENTNNALANDSGLGTPIGSNHYNLWRANFGNPPGSGSGLHAGQVPEPAAIGLVLVALAVGGLSRRMRAVKGNCKD